MNKATNKVLILFVILIFSVSITGCETMKLLAAKEDKSYFVRVPKKFTESVESFLITKDGQKLIVIGQRYSYIFPINDADVLKFVLGWSGRKYIKAEFHNFVLSSEKLTIGGQYVLVADSADLTPETKNLLISKGFSLNTGGVGGVRYSGKVEGKIYSLPDNFKLPIALRLNKNYQVDFSYLDEFETVNKFTGHKDVKRISLLATKILFLPITIVFDAVFFPFELINKISK